MRSFILIACLGVAALAQPPAPARRAAPGAAVNPNDMAPPPIRPEDKCTLEGVVTSAATGEPLKKARVSLRSIGQQNGIPYGTTTDAAGHFLFDDVDPGRYSFSASRNGYVSQQYSPDGNLKRGTTLTLANGQKMKQIVFKLTPQGVISGRILDEEGDPMVNVHVQCMVYGYSRGKRQLMDQDDASTNDLGEFRLYGLKPGKYVLSATYQSRDMFAPQPERPAAGAAAAVPQAEERYATTFYPSTTNPESATEIDVTPGAQISGLNMTLMRVRTVRVKGRLNMTVGNKPRRNANIALVPRNNTGFMMQRAVARQVDALGNFEMRGVVPGSYVLRADYVEDSKRFSARLPLEVGNSNIDGIELSLLPPLEITGRVTIADNGDLKGARLNVNLQSKQSGPMAGSTGTQVKDDLTFKLSNISLDPYDVNVRGLPDGFYLKSVRLGQQDVTETGVDFSLGVSAAELSIVVSPNGGEVEGTVQNAKGSPAAGATVTLIPDASHQSMMWLYKVANTDQNGHFSIKSIRPGDYKLYAWEDIEPGAYQDPDFVKPHESEAKSVSVKESGHETLQVKAIPAESAAGTPPR